MSKAKRKILVFIDWYLPGFKAGGPIRSVSNLVKVFGEELEFEIVTGNTDFSETEPYKEVPSDQWIIHKGARVIYLSPQNRTKKRFKEIIAESDAEVVYFNSFFSMKFTTIPLWILKWTKSKKKIILAPRGMLGKGALAIKPLKKHAFIRIAKSFGLYDKVTWHASTVLEQQEIERIFGKKAKVVVARNIATPEIDTSTPLPKKEPGAVRFFFLSRIALKKNLKKAIEWVQEVGADQQVTYDIYGPIDEPEYWQECQKLIDTHPKMDISHKGLVTHDQISATIRQYHFLLMPTFSENYGHAIVESFVNGCPVVISDQTPWLNLQEQKLGWSVALEDEAAFKQAIRDCIDMDQSTFTEMSDTSMAYGKSILSNTQDLNDNRELFLNA